MKFEEVPFTEVLCNIVDNRGKTCPTAESGMPLIATNCIRNDILYPTYEKIRYVNKATYEDWFRGHPEPGDIIFVTKGSPGRVCMTPDPVSFCIAQDMVAVRADKSKIDPDYLFAVLRSRDVQIQIENMHVGTMIPHFKKGDFDKLLLPVPDRASQELIGSLYRVFSNKIELNRQMNETLEAMARAIFKSWFVDFDPVRAKLDGRQPPGMDADTAALFPDSFEHVDGELVPQGWKLYSLPDATTFREGPGILAKDFHEDGVPLIRLAGLKNGVSLLDGCNFLDPEKVEKKWSHFRVEKGDVLLSTSASLGRVAEVDDEAVGAIPYTGIIAFRPQSSRTKQRYIRHYLTSTHFQLQVEAMGVGSVLRHFGPMHLKSMTMLVPSLAIQNAFSDLVEPLDHKVTHNLHESMQLASIRDTLLPKLLSGEIRVADAEEFAGEVV